MSSDLLSECRFTAHGLDCLVRVYPDVVCGYVVIQDEKHPLWGCGEDSPRVQALLSGGVTYARDLAMDGLVGWGIGFHNGGNIKKDFVDVMAQCRTLADAIDRLDWGRKEGVFIPLKDLRPAVLEYLGAPRMDKDESLDESWENAYGDERDQAYRAVLTAYWRQSTDRHVVVLTAKEFHPHVQRLVVLLIAETVAHWVGEPLQNLLSLEIAYLRSGVAWAGPCWDALERARSEVIWLRRVIADDMKWNVIETCIRTNPKFVIGDVLSAAVSLATRSLGQGSWDAAGIQTQIIGPDGPLKCLIETPENTDLKLLLTRWEASVDVARKLFLTG